MNRRIDDLATLNLQVFTLEIYLFTSQLFAPNVQELIGQIIASIVIQEESFCFHLFRVSAGHDVD
ncbi:hypothetical protein D3C86_2003530 [compost metagenome]